MKSRTLMEVVQSPGRKPLQQSPASACFRRAALPFMVDLPVVLVTLTLAFDPEPPHFVPEASQGIGAPALRRSIYVKQGDDISQARLPPGDRGFGHALHFNAAGASMPDGRQAGIGEDKRSRTIDLDQRPAGNGAPDPEKDPERHHDPYASQFGRSAFSQQI